MKKLICSLSKNRLLLLERGADDDRVVRKGRRNLEVKSLEQPASPTTYCTSAGVDSEERFVDDFEFFETGAQFMTEWDEWSAPEEGRSRSNQHSLNTIHASDMGRRASVHECGTPSRRVRKSKSIVALSDKLGGHLKESGYADGGGGDINDVQSLMAMTTGDMSTSKNHLNARPLERSNSDSNLGVKKTKKKKKERSKSAIRRDCEEPPPPPSALDKKMLKGGRKMETDVKTKSSHTKSTRKRSYSRSRDLEEHISPCSLDKKMLKGRRKAATEGISKSCHSETTRARSRSLSRGSPLPMKKSKSLTRFLEGKENKADEGGPKKAGKGKGKTNNDRKHKDNADTVVGSTKDTTTKMKEEKKKRRSIADVADEPTLSLASLSTSPKGKRKKGRDKTKISLKQEESTSDVYPVVNKNDQDVNGAGATALLDGFVTSCLASETAAEFRRAPRRHSTSGMSSITNSLEPKVRRHVRRHSSSDLSELAGLETPNYIVTDNHLNDSFGKDPFEEVLEGDRTSLASARIQSTLNAALAGSHCAFGGLEESDQKEKVASLQNLLSEALHSMLAISREQIEDKDQILKASSELSRTMALLNESWEERMELVNEIKDRDATIIDERRRVDKLERAIERLLDTQDDLEVQLERTQQEKEKLLTEMQQLEERMDNAGGGASLSELRETRMALEERVTECLSQKSRIEELEEELKKSMIVPQLQIEELDTEIKALQEKLVGERLEFAAQLAASNEAMGKLQQELESYRVSNDAPDLASAKQKLKDAYADATSVREDLISANKMIASLQKEKDAVVTRNSSLQKTIEALEQKVKELTDETNLLTGKVKSWTQRAYEWKTKAESAERRLKGEVLDDTTQSLFVQAAIEKGKKSRWPFLSNGSNEDDTADHISTRTQEDNNKVSEDVVAELRQEMERMRIAHRDELSITNKRITQLEGENEALTLQNATLEQLSRASSEADAKETHENS